jgi:hypothetical protein
MLISLGRLREMWKELKYIRTAGSGHENWPVVTASGKLSIYQN